MINQIRGFNSPTVLTSIWAALQGRDLYWVKTIQTVFFSLKEPANEVTPNMQWVPLHRWKTFVSVNTGNRSRVQPVLAEVPAAYNTLTAGGGGLCTAQVLILDFSWRRTPTEHLGAHTTATQHCLGAIQFNWHPGNPGKEVDRRAGGNTEHYNQSMCMWLMINLLSALSPGCLDSSLCIKASPSCWCCQ